VIVVRTVASLLVKVGAGVNGKARGRSGPPPAGVFTWALNGLDLESFTR
jgi:hypothetical protein